MGDWFSPVEDQFLGQVILATTGSSKSCHFCLTLRTESVLHTVLLILKIAGGAGRRHILRAGENAL